jgi:hypothetical protein
MTRTHYVKKALKDNPVCKKGESYYWWKFRRGSKQYSLTPPKPAQLTQSEFLSAVEGLRERIGGIDGADLAAARIDVEDIAGEIRELGEEQGEKLSNMPDGLQQGPTGELLNGRADSCEEWAGEVEGVDLDLEKEEGESQEDFDARVESAIKEVQNADYQGE